MHVSRICIPVVLRCEGLNVRSCEESILHHRFKMLHCEVRCGKFRKTTWSWPTDNSVQGLVDARRLSSRRNAVRREPTTCGMRLSKEERCKVRLSKVYYAKRDGVGFEHTLFTPSLHNALLHNHQVSCMTHAICSSC